MAGHAEVPTPETVRARQAAMDRATALLTIHVTAADGTCDGCISAWSRLVPATNCTEQAWARSVLETHGVDDHWNPAPARPYRSGDPQPSRRSTLFAVR